MKLSEINPKDRQDASRLVELIQKLKVPEYELELVNGEMVVNCKTDVDLGFQSFDKLPFKFNVIQGELAFGPNKELKSIEGFPSKAKAIDISNTGITSLVGISDIVQETTIFYMQNTNVTEGGMGLILIKNLIHIEYGKLYSTIAKGKADPFEIIEKYLGRPDDIFDCQNELIEAGLEEYAQL